MGTELRALLTWVASAGTKVSVSSRVVYLLTQESEQLRLITFEIYASILAKVSRMTLAFPLRHQILNLLILLVLHLKDVNAAVVEVRSRTVEPGIQFSLEVNAEHGKPLDRAVAGSCDTEGAH